MQREMIPELMDAPELDPGLHAEALEGLSRMNRASAAAQIMARPILELAREQNRGQMTLLDVACGGGDVPVEIAEIARRKGLTLQLVLTDQSATALQRAQALAGREGVACRVLAGRAPDGLPSGDFDVVTNSLFLHHLERASVVATLRAMAQRATRLLVISDLRRSVMGYGVAWTASRFFSRSRIVHHDGPVSVRAAWTIGELRKMTEEAGIGGAEIAPCWPWRMLLTFRRAEVDRGSRDEHS